MREIKFRCWLPSFEQMNYRVVMNGEINEILNKEGPVYMQYSGLKDRYGKEIYEGDIIKNESGEGYDILSVVAYKKGVFCIDANDELDYIEYPLYEWNCEAEVIGNIYENPELLEGETNV